MLFIPLAWCKCDYADFISISNCYYMRTFTRHEAQHINVLNIRIGLKEAINLFSFFSGSFTDIFDFVCVCVCVCMCCADSFCIDVQKSIYLIFRFWFQMKKKIIQTLSHALFLYPAAAHKYVIFSSSQWRMNAAPPIQMRIWLAVTSVYSNTFDLPTPSDIHIRCMMCCCVLFCVLCSDSFDRRTSVLCVTCVYLNNALHHHSGVSMICICGLCCFAAAVVSSPSLSDTFYCYLNEWNGIWWNANGEHSCTLCMACRRASLSILVSWEFYIVYFIYIYRINWYGSSAQQEETSLKCNMSELIM